MMRFFGCVLALLCAMVWSTQVQAATIEVAQETSGGAGDYNSNVLGFIDSFDTALSLADYYAYDTITYSFNGPAPSIASDTSHVFFVNSAIDGLALVLVHDLQADGTGGTAVLGVSLTGDANGFNALVSDEPSDEVDQLDANTFAFDHAWANCCGDGVALGSLDGDLWNAFVTFSAYTGITNWVAVSAGGTTIPLDLTVGQTVRLRPIPEPATMSLLALGVSTLLLRRRRERLA